ncbi:MAG TPA: hypothetical protein VI159_00510 [Gemmatimonadales bacterium]
MKPFFSVHGGEYLVGSEIERRSPKANVWVPSRDTGVDLLVSDGRNRRTCSLQVKFSKDFLVTEMGPEFQGSLRACGWWALRRDKISRSKADYWVMVLMGFDRTTDFVIVPTHELLRRLSRIHPRQSRLQVYLWVTKKGKCWETRDLRKRDQLLVAHGEFKDKARDFTRWLNLWSFLSPLDR